MDDVKTTFPLFASVFLGFFAGACASEVAIMPDASDESAVDAGTVTEPDTGVVDAARPHDAGLDADLDDGGSDAGPLDAGPLDGGVLDSGMMSDAGRPPPPPPPVDCDNDPISSFAGVVQTLSGRTPIEGVRVCVLEHPEIPCATTDSVGYYELACAPVGEAAISFQVTDYSTGIWLWNGEAGMNHELSVFLVTPEENTIYFSATGVSYPNGTTGLITITFSGNAAGLTASLRSGSGDGPFYTINEGGQVSATAITLESSSEFAYFMARPTLGWHELEIELSPTTGIVCGHANGIWQARDGMPNVIRMPIRTDSETVIAVRCE